MGRHGAQSEAAQLSAHPRFSMDQISRIFKECVQVKIEQPESLGANEVIFNGGILRVAHEFTRT